MAGTLLRFTRGGPGAAGRRAPPSHAMPRRRVSSSVRLPPFQTLLDAHGADVHRFLVASVGRVDADDCYQETWLAALRAYPRLRDASNLRSWIFTVAHRKVIDHVRARRRVAVPVGEPPERAGDERTVGAGRRPVGRGPRACAQAAHGPGPSLRGRRRLRGDLVRDGHERGRRAAKRPRGPQATANGVPTMTEIEHLLRRRTTTPDPLPDLTAAAAAAGLLDVAYATLRLAAGDAAAGRHAHAGSSASPT